MTQLIDEQHRPHKSRLLKHREKNCECWDCWQEICGLPPAETHEEEIRSYRFAEREVKRARKKAKKEVRDGKQATISSFFAPKKVPQEQSPTLD